jgi:hypothetical protein
LRCAGFISVARSAAFADACSLIAAHEAASLRYTSDIRAYIDEVNAAVRSAASILEDVLTRERPTPGFFGLAKGSGITEGDFVLIPDQMQERLIFAAYEVEKRAKALRAHLLGIE